MYAVECTAAEQQYHIRPLLYFFHAVFLLVNFYEAFLFWCKWKVENRWSAGDVIRGCDVNFVVAFFTIWPRMMTSNFYFLTPKSFYRSFEKGILVLPGISFHEGVLLVDPGDSFIISILTAPRKRGALFEIFVRYCTPQRLSIKLSSRFRKQNGVFVPPGCGNSNQASSYGHEMPPSIKSFSTRWLRYQHGLCI